MSCYENRNTGVPGPTPAEIELSKLADEYMRRCDEFDRNHGAMVGGFWQSNGMYATYLCHKHAVEVDRELRIRAEGLGFSAREWGNAKHRAQAAERRARR